MKHFPIFSLKKNLNNQYQRDEFVIENLKFLEDRSSIIDAGCGSQRYREYCGHLSYKSQDFGAYTVDEKKTIGTEGVGGTQGYDYGQIDYIGDIWNIDAPDGEFDSILCTEVFEHIPYPVETIKEFSRILKPGGKLILTAPSNCLRHMDPYFFYTGFSDRWYERILSENKFKIVKLEPVGDYYSWISVEMARTIRNNKFLGSIMLGPAFFFFYLKNKTEASIDTMCEGYHILAEKLP